MDPRPLNPANRLGLDYRALAATLPFAPEAAPGAGPGAGHAAIVDAHVHIHAPPDDDSATLAAFLDAANRYGIGRIWTQTPLEQVDHLRQRGGDRFEFVATPNYAARDREDTWTTDWLARIEAFRAKGSRIAKFWAAPRGLDFHESVRLDHPTRRAAMRLARSLGMVLMVHVADPDTWFATKYRDAARYGAKPQHYERLERVMEEFGDALFLAAHMAGHPEDLDHLQRLLDRHPNLYLDTSATKWMVRELSKRPDELRDFCGRNLGRIFFGTDIVVNPKDAQDYPGCVFDLYASRYWALRTLLETDYDGPSPIVDPDLSLVDPTLPAESTARLRGARIGPDVLRVMYGAAAPGLLARTGR